MAEIDNKYDKIKYNNEFNKNNYDSLRIVVPKGVKPKIHMTKVNLIFT